MDLRIDGNNSVSFPKWFGLELDSRRVDMGVDDPHPIFDRLCSNDEKHKGAVPIDRVPSRTRRQIGSRTLRGPRLESFGLRKLHAFTNKPHLTLSAAHEVFEVLAERHDLGAFFRTELGPGGTEAIILGYQRLTHDEKKRQDQTTNCWFHK